MKYSVSEISEIISAESYIRNDGVVDHLLTDSRSLYFPETSVFFALKTQTNDGHRYIDELYRRGVRSFVISKESESVRSRSFTSPGPDANFLIVSDVLKSLQ
ncbi:MAG: bifunctional UDP-N-acetylmuramoyl-tripeptide:D-alanyl-D-alanine ligase/alanine racemase, partial [Tannerella sp.]|nr:bifunctional UDP-N-acetylmuramoyl-tripeptide:D-alanyl-D-alanine ligase/alanine racemase [Tannerella sp.]